jgi:hypothetical protein
MAFLLATPVGAMLDVRWPSLSASLLRARPHRRPPRAKANAEIAALWTSVVKPRLEADLGGAGRFDLTLAAAG